MARPNIEFRHLRYFVILAEELHFRRAALRLHISQPPLTRQIQQLEQELGVTLFERKGRGIDLTQAGAVFLDDARNILLLLDQAVEKSQLTEKGLIGRLDIGIFGSAIFDLFPSVVPPFRALFPKINVSLHDMNKSEQIKALRDRRLSVGFIRFVWDELDLAKELVSVAQLYVACPANHNLARLDEIRVSDLDRQPLILYPKAPRPSFIDRVVSLCRDEGFEPFLEQEVDDVITAVALVSSGQGIAIVPEAVRNFSMPGVVYRPMQRLPSTMVDLYCLYRKDDRSPILQAFLKFMRTIHGRGGTTPNADVPLLG
jgi:LysR family transcriptional regulator, benzoate and cis,cis-muconate-responsive activator of ben and cat genes